MEDADGAGGTAARVTVPWQVRAVGAALSLMVLATVVGTAFAPTLLRWSPVVLLIIQPAYAQMGLALSRVDPVVFVVVAASRRWLGEVVMFAAARVLGPEVSKRLGRRPVRLPASWDERGWWARDLVAVAVSNPLVSAALGLTRMGWVRFVVLKAVGSVLWVLVVRWAFGRIGTTAEAATTFVESNARVLTVVTIAAVGLWWVVSRRRDSRR